MGKFNFTKNVNIKLFVIDDLFENITVIIFYLILF